MFDEAQFMEGKAQISYPCPWEYRVIGFSEDTLRDAIQRTFLENFHTVRLANRSSNGKYLSMVVEIIVDSDEIRNSWFHTLRSQPEVKMVL
jgi:putative lipoic acid-binding regulatory protein